MVNNKNNYFGLDYFEYDFINNKPYFRYQSSIDDYTYVLLNKNKAIYVGVPCDVRARIMTHKRHRDFDKVYLFKFTRDFKFKSRIKAEKLERNLIRNLNPKYNIIHKKIIL